MKQDLTSEQEALMLEIIEEWTKVPFDTSSIDKEKAEAAINLTYECVGEDRPKKIIWFNNPLKAAIWMVNNFESLNNEKFFSAVSFNLYWDDIVYDALKQIDSNLLNQFELNFNKSIHRKHLSWLSGSFLTDFINCHIRHHFRSLLGEKIYLARREVFEELEDFEVHEMHDTYYLAATFFFHQVGIDCSKFIGYWDAAKYCGLWWAFYDIAVVVPKPSIICLDDEYKLHGEGEPAIVYKGFELYAHHGKYIDSEIIT